MKVIRSVNDMTKTAAHLQQSKQQVGFVPTMGYLHEGHLALMEEAREENDIVVVSIFVNPLQFGPDEDYEQYPRHEEQDAKNAEAAGVDILFMPDAKEMYPTKMKIVMTIHDRVDVLCGRSRPGHFDGVAAVLSKLFNIVSPDKTYFGMKDAQQLAVVDALISDLNFPIELIGVKTAREHSGLAKSSRNVYLTQAEQEEASWIYKALKSGQRMLVDGEKNPAMIVKEVTEIIQAKTTGSIDYVDVLSYPALKPVETVDRQIILACAVHFHDARLIDNIVMDPYGNMLDRIQIQ